MVLLLAAVLGGAALTYLFEDDERLLVRIALGGAIGMALTALVGYAAAAWLGMGTAAVAVTGALLLAPVALFRRGDVRSALREDLARAWPRSFAPRAAGAVLLQAVMAIALVLVFDRAVFERADGLYTGVDHNLGDLPFHLAIVRSFTWGANFPPEHPELAGARLTYPFAVDAGAALLATAGLSLRRALLLQNVVLAFGLLAALQGFAVRLTGERAAGPLTALLVFLSGGMGFVLLLRDAAASRNLLDLLWRLPRDYTLATSGLRWGNALTTLLIPQRALLLGLPLALLAWTSWWEALRNGRSEAQQSRRMAAAGVLTSLLPLCHSHSYAVTLAIGAWLAWTCPPRRRWLAFFGPALAIGLPQAVWLARGSAVRATSFVGWQLGWDRGELDPLSFWLLNTGVFLPLLVVALAWRRRAPLLPASVLRFWAPFSLCFLVPNLLRLSPWIWDNVKFLFLWFVASAPLVALLLVRLARVRRGGPLWAAVLLVLATLSGALDVWRVVSRAIAHRVFSADALAFAVAVARATPPRALILHHPTYNAPSLLTGRRSLLGYPGHIWSQGLAAGAREKEIERIYSGAPDQRALLDRHGVDFVVVGPQEWTAYGPPGPLLARLPVVARSRDHVLLDARP